MSVTITAVPFMLIGSLITAAAMANIKEEIKTSGGNALHVQKEYETVFVDQDLLTKTLIEHGARELSIIKNYVVCEVDDYVLRFSREGEEPYKLEVMCNNKNAGGCDKTVAQMIDEYSQNVQEATYVKIKERLEEKNLEISQEEILEDNSIMLTVNLN